MARGQCQQGGHGRDHWRNHWRDKTNTNSSLSSSSSSIYDLTTPFIIKIAQQQNCKPLVQDEVKMCTNTTFGLFHKDEVIYICYLTHCFFLEHVVKKWTECTNIYSNDNCNKRKIKEVKEHHILQFLAISYYMGFVCLPSKMDHRK